MTNADRQAMIDRGQAQAIEAPPPYTQADVEAYRRAAAHIVKDHPELTDGTAINSVLAAGFPKDGAMHPTVITRAIKDRRPDFQAYVLSERGRADLHALNNVQDDEARSVREYDRIIGWLDRHGTYKQPATRRDEVSDYLEQRRNDIREGKRRR